jgi:hypothetical protein
MITNCFYKCNKASGFDALSDNQVKTLNTGHNTSIVPLISTALSKYFQFNETDVKYTLTVNKKLAVLTVKNKDGSDSIRTLEKHKRTWTLITDASKTDSVSTKLSSEVSESISETLKKVRIAFRTRFGDTETSESEESSEEMETLPRSSLQSKQIEVLSPLQEKSTSSPIVINQSPQKVMTDCDEGVLTRDHNSPESSDEKRHGDSFDKNAQNPVKAKVMRQDAVDIQDVIHSENNNTSLEQTTEMDKTGTAPQVDPTVLLTKTPRIEFLANSILGNDSLLHSIDDIESLTALESSIKTNAIMATALLTNEPVLQESSAVVEQKSPSFDDLWVDEFSFDSGSINDSSIDDTDDLEETIQTIDPTPLKDIEASDKEISQPFVLKKDHLGFNHNQYKMAFVSDDSSFEEAMQDWSPTNSLLNNPKGLSQRSENSFENSGFQKEHDKKLLDIRNAATINKSTGSLNNSSIESIEENNLLQTDIMNSLLAQEQSRNNATVSRDNELRNVEALAISKVGSDRKAAFGKSRTDSITNSQSVSLSESSDDEDDGESVIINGTT